MLTLNWHGVLKTDTLFALFLIFHHEEMALRDKQSVIHEKQEFVKLRVQD